MHTHTYQETPIYCSPIPQIKVFSLVPNFNITSRQSHYKFLPVKIMLSLVLNQLLPKDTLNRSFCFFLILDCEAIGTVATPGLLCQPRVIVKMIVEKLVEWILAGETEVLGEKNLPQRHFCPSQNPTWPDPGLNLGRHGGKLATNCLNYGAA
jgi:hypothetical protein